MDRTPAAPPVPSHRCCTQPAGAARWWGTPAPGMGGGRWGTRHSGATGLHRSAIQGLHSREQCPVQFPCTSQSPARQVRRHQALPALYSAVRSMRAAVGGACVARCPAWVPRLACCRAWSRKLRRSKPSAPKIACCTRLASFRFSPESNTSTRRRARPRMSAADRPAGPPPAAGRGVGMRVGCCSSRAGQVA